MKQVLSFIFTAAFIFSLAGCINPLIKDLGIDIKYTDSGMWAQSSNSIRVVMTSDFDSSISIITIQLLKDGNPVPNIFPKWEVPGKQVIFENVPVDTGYKITMTAQKHYGCEIPDIDLAAGGTVSKAVKLTKKWKVSVFAGAASGYTDGLTGTSAAFSTPLGLAFDRDGALYVADSVNRRVRKLDSIEPPLVQTVAGDGDPSGGFSNAPPSFAGTTAKFKTPAGFAFARDASPSADILYVTDSAANTVRKIWNFGTPGTDYHVLTIAGDGTGGTSGSDDNAGDGLNAKFNAPTGLAYDSTRGILYVADSGNHTIREVIGLGSANGVQRFAGQTGTDGTVNGLATSAATFNSPKGLAFDSANNVLYVADRYTIRKITNLNNSPTRTVFTIAGTGSAGNADGDGTSASFDTPSSIALNSAGTILYVADSGNHTIRKIDLATTTVTTIAGDGTAGHDEGAGTAAQFGSPNGIAVNSEGDLYVTDASASFHGVKKLTRNW